MDKLKRIGEDIRIKFIIGILAVITLFAFFLWGFTVEQGRTIDKHHFDYIKRADTTIATLLNQAQLNSYITSREIAKLLRRIKDGEIEKEDLIKHLEVVEKREEATGILLNQHVLLVVGMEEHNILARSEWVMGARIPLPQEGYIRDNWTPSLAFEQAFATALEGRVDVRKIIYDRDFLRREGYDFWGAEGMGLTVMTPIIDEEDEKQKGVLISVTFLNANVPVVLGLKAVTDVSFTAILPSGHAIGSIFETDSVAKIEKISRSPELLAAAREKAAEKGSLIRRGIRVSDRDFILGEFTIERTRLTRIPIFGDGVEGGIKGATHYYRVVYWLELDHQGNFASLRGIAMEADVYVEQENFLILLFGGIAVFLLAVFVFFYLLVQKKLVRPITSFTNQLENLKEDERVEIQKNYQEFVNLEDAFNSSLDQAKEARDILEIKVKAKTRQLSELSASLEKQVEEKTRDLQARINELERFKNITIGREAKMIELKEEIARQKEGMARLKEEVAKELKTKKF